jgi:1,4-alpha-glucan branching enzyme
MLTAPQASSVTVAGTFNGWDTHATPLRRAANGEWRVDLPLGAGRYNYMFVVDGQRWVLDPSAARDAADDFGTANSVVMVAVQRQT